jgi:S-formylglutathione hydrolase FrmB
MKYFYSKMGLGWVITLLAVTGLMAQPAMPGLMSDATFFNENLQLFYLSCGEQDLKLEYTQKLIDNFVQHGLDIEFETCPGTHEWILWRLSLADFLPRLFN